MANNEQNMKGAEGKKIPNVVRFKPPMDFLRAKLTLGMKSSSTYEELSMDDVQKSFVAKSMQVLIIYDKSVTYSLTKCFRPTAK